MSNGDDEQENARKSHIKRIYQNDDPESSVWIDIERMDEVLVISSRGQRSHWIFHWEEFDPDNSAKKRIEDPNDKDTYIDIPIRNSVRVVMPSGAYEHRFLNDETNLSRSTHSRRIYHRDIKEDYLVEGLPPRDPDDYLNSLDEQELGHYVEVEILDYYVSKGREDRDQHRHHQSIHSMAKRPKPAVTRNLKRVWLGKTGDPLLKEPLKEADLPDPDFTPVYNPDAGPQIDPPWRIDPLQNIVNINWGGLAVIFGPEADDAPKPDKDKNK